jgi:hypothetical protein
VRGTVKFLFTGLLLSLAASKVSAQAWDSPFLASPRPAPGLGLFLVDLHGAGVGAMVTWLPSSTSWGLRGGIAERHRDGLVVFGGADVSAGLTRATSEMPLDIDAVFGVGAAVGDDLILSVPVGLTVGHTFTGQGATFTPYVTPRVVVDARFGDGEGDNLDLDFTVDLGLDLRIQPGWMVRFGGSIGDREAIAIGIVF